MKENTVKFRSLIESLTLIAVVTCANGALAEAPGDPKAVKQEDGRYSDAKGDPTYNIQPDGKIDWSTYSGFRRYHSECHVCHGPEGEGSSYAPALKNSLKTLGYADFYGIVVGGKQEIGNGNDKVMPAFGDNKNVICYLDDIYVYLRARSTEAVPRGRPGAHEDKSREVTAKEHECLGIDERG
jgi:methanol metabolism-related c-type cytochrome